jgi:hypothetical protein
MLEELPLWRIFLYDTAIRPSQSEGKFREKYDSSFPYYEISRELRRKLAKLAGFILDKDDSYYSDGRLLSDKKLWIGVEDKNSTRYYGTPENADLVNEIFHLVVDLAAYYFQEGYAKGKYWLKQLADGEISAEQLSAKAMRRKK